MKGAFHDFLTICSSDLSNRQKMDESIHDIRGYVEKRSHFLDAPLSPSFSFVRSSRAIWMDRALHLRKKKVYRIRHDVRV